jgi:myosin-1
MSVLADPPPAIVREPKGYQYNTSTKLGNGGFAICYSAELHQSNKPTGKIVALKIVKNQKDKRILQKVNKRVSFIEYVPSSSEQQLTCLAIQFASELQLHSKLHHPNIVEFYRAFSFENNTYVVLELCHNGSLADALKQRKFFTMPEIRRFLIQLCGAVKYLHHRNIVHRDLKTGNVLLDKGMNIKIADFGLAAVLVSAKDVGIRRTTMCGTPNYLAPEILEKHGHNDKADLWSIGIIVYTLAVGKAPFHSSSKEEIYKKALAMKYEWPDVATHKNDISSDLKELVSALLVYEEEERPGPDQIVSHPFFKLQFIPETLDSSCTKTKPTWPPIKPPTAETIKRGYSESWYKLCKTSGVGEYASGQVFPLNGAKRIVSIVKDCEREVAAGRAPIVPMPKDAVYLPFPERVNLLEAVDNLSSDSGEENGTVKRSRKLAEITGNDRSNKPATVRVIAQPSRRLKENIEPQVDVDQAVESMQTLKRQTSERRKRVETKPVVSQQPVAERKAIPRPKGTETRQAVTVRSRQVEVRRVADKPTLSLKPSMRDAPMHDKIIVKVPDEPVEVHQKHALPAQDRKPSGMDAPARRLGTVRKVSRQEQLPKVKPTPEVVTISDSASSSSQSTDNTDTSTDPSAVLERAARLRDNIAAALSGKRPVPKRSYKPSSLPFVAKWVDYARKHGVGYVLEDGTIGCLFNSTSKYPVTYAVVRDGYRHLQLVGKDMERINSVPIEHWVQNAKDELLKGGVVPERRRTTGILWAKFGKYMCAQLGESQVQGETIVDAYGNAVFPRYYQRLGAVGVWGFSDGSLQVSQVQRLSYIPLTSDKFNFPDHTKLVISADGTYCNFTCLSTEAMAYLKQNGDLPFKYIRSRKLLSGSPTELMFGTSKGKGDMQTILTTEANMLREKLRLVVTVVGQWIAGGGLGCSPDGEVQRVEWNGPQLDEGKKEEWTTVGRFGGDIRAQ